MRAYFDLFNKRGSYTLVISGLVARLPSGTLGVALVLLVTSTYGSVGSAGGIAGAYAFGEAITAPLLSRLADAHGQARVILPLLISATGAMCFGVALATLQGPLVIVYALFFFGGAATGSFGAFTRRRWVALTSSGDSLQTAFALESMIDEIVFIFGPAIAVWAAANGSPSVTVYVIVGVGAAGGAWLLLSKSSAPSVILGPHRRVSFRMKAVISAVRQVFEGVGILLGVLFLVGVFLGSINVTIISFFAELSLEQLAGAVISMLAVGSFIGALGYGSRASVRRLDRQLLSTVSVIVCGAFVTIVFNDVIGVSIGLLVCGLGIAPTFIVGNNLTYRLRASHRLTEGFAVNTSTVGLGVALGAALSGAVIELCNTSLAGFAVGVSSSLGAFLLCLTALGRSEFEG